jgi:acetylglutamate synthase
MLLHALCHIAMNRFYILAEFFGIGLAGAFSFPLLRKKQVTKLNKIWLPQLTSILMFS